MCRWLSNNELIYGEKVRGAPAIAIVGALSLAIELLPKSFQNLEELVSFVTEKLNYLKTARPTAVNMAEAVTSLTQFVKEMPVDTNPEQAKLRLLDKIESMLCSDIADNKAVGKYGAEDMISKSHGKEKLRVLTHCNTGSLASWGSRLTAYELVYEKMPATLIADSMVSMAMKMKGIDAVVVGADRVVANGDTANKIGTYQLALAV
ncbi:hypothetical protein QZH41_003525 [Actinostola sp. cb2023]|nr:hypothetical protein QZH41_003525 [Actinostola sp. cb2023]